MPQVPTRSIRALVVPVWEDGVVVTGPRQALVGERRDVSRETEALPLDDTVMLLKVWSYRLVRRMAVRSWSLQSSQWLPMSVTPGTILPPICAMIVMVLQAGNPRRCNFP